jgi:iron complex outermembrane receptor protein
MSANQVTSSMEVVETKQVDRMASVNIISAMQQISGITIYDEQPSIRGSSGYTYGAGSRVLTLMNGLPMVTADRASVSWDMLPADNIQQIEVFKGASSVLYGAGAMGGVINLITADPADTARTVVRFGTSIFDRPANDSADWDRRSSAISPNLNFFHSRRVGRLDLTMLSSFIKETGYRREEFSNRFRGMFMTKYHFVRDGEGAIKNFYVGLNAQVSVDSSATIVAWSSYPADTGTAIFNNGSSVDTLIGFTLGGALTPGDGFLSYQLLYRYSLDPTISIEGRRWSAQYNGRWFRNVNEINTGQSGVADLWYNDLHLNYRVGEWLQLAGGLNYTVNQVDALATFGIATGTQYAGFLQARVKAGKRWNFILGARYQFEEMTGDTATTGENKGKFAAITRTTINEPIFRAGVNFQAAQGTFLRASFGQAVRSPSVAERFTTTQAGPINVIPAPDIRIERGYTAELGVKQLFAAGANYKFKGVLDVAGFVTDFQNMVEFYIDTATLIQTRSIAFNAQNVSSAYITGVEANLNFQYAVNNDWGIYFGGGVTYTNPIDRDGDPALNGDDSTSKFVTAAFLAFTGGLQGEFPSDRPEVLKYRSRTLARANVEFYYKRWSFTTNFRYTSRMVNVDKIFLISIFFPGTQNFRARYNENGWGEVDFVLAYNLPQVTLSAHVFNALNQQFMTIPGTLGEQRRFALQAKFTF